MLIVSSLESWRRIVHDILSNLTASSCEVQRNKHWILCLIHFNTFINTESHIPHIFVYKNIMWLPLIWCVCFIEGNTRDVLKREEWDRDAWYWLRGWWWGGGVIYVEGEEYFLFYVKWSPIIFAKTFFASLSIKYLLFFWH